MEISSVDFENSNLREGYFRSAENLNLFRSLKDVMVRFQQKVEALANAECFERKSYRSAKIEGV